MDFRNNKLNILGTSYNYGISYENSSNITRKLIIENMETYKQYYYTLDSTKDGLYNVISLDKKDKSYVWYNNDIDISNLPKGKYSLYVYTKVGDYADYGEIVDMFGIFEEQISTINNKKYTIAINKDRQNRFELKVE